jgi:AraC-like DNA-binding protein
MFSMTGSIGVGSSRLSASFVGCRGIRGHVLRRDNLTFDTRFAAPAHTGDGSGSAVGQFFFFPRGITRVYGRTDQGEEISSPVAYLLRDDEIDRVGPNTDYFLRSYGHRCEVIQLHLPREDWLPEPGLVRGPVALPVSTIELGNLLTSLIGTRELSATFVQFGRALEAAGIVRPGIFAPCRVETNPSRFLSVIASRYKSLDTTATLKKISDDLGVSLRHLGRGLADLTSSAGLPSFGFREDLRVVRLRLATLLLSAPDANVSLVADKIGYSGVIAMSRAFRDAGLPPPKIVRRHLLGAGSQTQPSPQFMSL